MEREIILSITIFVSFLLYLLNRRPQLTIQDCQNILSFEELTVYRDQGTQESSNQVASINGDRVSCLYLREEGFGYVRETFDIKVKGFWGNLNIYLENEALVGISLNYSIRRKPESRRENFLVQKIIADIQRAMIMEEILKKRNIAVTPAPINTELPDYVRN